MGLIKHKGRIIDNKHINKTSEEFCHEEKRNGVNLEEDMVSDMLGFVESTMEEITPRCNADNNHK